MSSASKIGERCHFLLFVEMARLLFELFYDEDFISETMFWKWFQSPDQEETNGHKMISESTKEFFDWLLLSESETTEEEDGDDDDDNERK